MMTTKKRLYRHCNFIVVAALGMLVTSCGPPGAHELQQGQQEIQAGQFADAVVVLKEAVSILGNAPHAEQAKAWNLLGEACQGSGRLDDASKAYMTALKLDRDNAAIDYNLGGLRSQQTNFPGAVDYFTTYVTLRSKDLRGFLQLGAARYHYALERTGVERARLMEAARRDFENAERVSHSAEAANAIGMLEFQHRSPSAESIRAAAKDFTLALQRDPHFAPALLNLAILSQQYFNQPAQALDLYRQYLALSPAPPHAREVAKLAHDLDVKQRVIITPQAAPTRAYTPAQDHSYAPTPVPGPAPPPAKASVVPSNAAAVLPKPVPADSLSVPLTTPVSAPSSPPQTSSGQAGISAPPSATQSPPEAASVKPSNSVTERIVVETVPAPRNKITQRLNPLNWFSGKPKAAASGAPLAVEPPPLLAGSHFEYPPSITPIPGDRAQARQIESEAIHAKQTGDFAQSIQAYKEAAKADPTYYDAFYGLGLTALDVRDYSTALDALHRALALQEDSTDARYAFAWALQKRGYTEDAVHELGRLLAQHPNEARAHLLLGSLYAEKLREPKLAREQFIQTLTLDPDNAQAASIRAWLKLNP